MYQRKLRSEDMRWSSVYLSFLHFIYAAADPYNTRRINNGLNPTRSLFSTHKSHITCPYLIYFPTAFVSTQPASLPNTLYESSAGRDITSGPSSPASAYLGVGA